MVHRVAGRRGWLPAQLAWAPVLVTGILLLVGFEMSVRERSGDVWSVRLLVQSPLHWFDPAMRGAAGISLVVLGLFLLFVASWQPRPGRMPLTVTRFPGFSLAAILLAIVSMMVLFSFTGHVVDAARGGVDWRFLVAWRSHALDLAIGWTAAAAALVAYVFSFAGPWHSLRVRALYGRPRRAAEPEAQQDV